MIRTRHQQVDLIRFRAQHCVIPSKVCGRGTAALETEREPLDGAEAPGDAGRKERIHERVCMREHGPSRRRRARQAMLDARSVGERHEWPGVAEQRTDRGIAVQQVLPHLFR